ncbi:MAG: hypothetical protein ACHQDC_02295 [Acidimicrobiales bacterium]
MLDSPIVEVAFGLVVLFFVLASGASAVVEIISAATRKRAKDLEKEIANLVGDPETLEALKQTSVFEALIGRNKKFPSYVSARSFASAVEEMKRVTELCDWPESRTTPLLKRLDGLVHHFGDDISARRAGLERWFDETMARLGGAYKRWTLVWLFLIGLVLAIGVNASATQVAANLWSDPAAREAVADSAANRVSEGTAESEAPKDESLADAASNLRNQLDDALLPIGWTESNRPESVGGWIVQVAGWLITAAMVTLGAPFWFGLLTKVVSLRATGAKPPVAAEDPLSATTATTASLATDVTAAITATPATRGIGATADPEPAPPPEPTVPEQTVPTEPTDPTPPAG